MSTSLISLFSGTIAVNTRQGLLHLMASPEIDIDRLGWIFKFYSGKTQPKTALRLKFHRLRSKVFSVLFRPNWVTKDSAFALLSETFEKRDQFCREELKD